MVCGIVDPTELRCVPVEDDEFARLQLRDGDLSFVRANGNPGDVGRCAVFVPEAVRDTGSSPNDFISLASRIAAHHRFTGG